MMDFLTSLENLRFSIWVRESGTIWAFPTILWVHTIAMSMVAGGSAMIDLALLGFFPRAQVKPLERFYPLIWIGFAISAITGTMLLVADATTKLTNPDFGVKMVFVAAGLYLTHVMRGKVFGDPGLDQGKISSQSKMLAWASLACWFAVITAGRLLAYVGPVSGLQGVTNK